MEPNKEQTRKNLSRRERIDVLFAEYDSLNQLLRFRLTAMDRRLPVAVTFMAATIAAVLALPLKLQLAVLIATPSAILWIGRTTVQHARAKEDNLRRISEIEQQVNEIAGEELLLFQSRHPNRAATVGGRTGMSVVFATTLNSLLMLLVCVALFGGEHGQVAQFLYLVFVGAIAWDLIMGAVLLNRYVYQRRPVILLEN
ncbi:hypothetical protein Enr13x_37540 [Stieleria neptunia]|uniref:Uncharacterized protein n=2 Tax=Stieleria neptunia TaxID=2527979 RepID=A0A518HSV9_9BACT|nr:hypothetical protein Enr13x_37540 [Stieleria neptunia]